MGLASQFGDHAYECKNCGNKMELYAPRCPVCGNKKLTHVKTEKSPEGFRRVNEEVRDTTKTAPPAVSIAVLIIILAIGMAVASMFAPPRQESMTKPEPSPVVEPTAKSQASAHVSNSQSSKRIKRANSHPVISKTHDVSTTSYSTPKPVTKMKLWEASSDDEGGNP